MTVYCVACKDDASRMRRWANAQGAELAWEIVELRFANGWPPGHVVLCERGKLSIVNIREDDRFGEVPGTRNTDRFKEVTP